MIHSLGRCNYLKIEKTNHLLFACQDYWNRQVCIQEQYNDNEDQTKFDDIYRIKIFEPTLRELMMIQSIYACKQQSDIEIIVKEQPSPAIFFKVFLELDIKSMVAYLSYDSGSTRALLDESHDQYFRENDFETFPVFFKNRD